MTEYELKGFPWLTPEEETMTARKAPAAAKTRSRKAAPQKTSSTPTKVRKAPAAKKVSAAEREANMKAKHAATERKLAPKAKEINIRLDKADQMDGKADEHRLAAAIILAAAKDACEADSLNFKNWCGANIEGRSWESTRKLARIGAAPEPKQALEDLRGRERGAAQKQRDKKKADSKSKSEPAGKRERQASPLEVADAALERLGDKGARSFVESVAANQGQAVVSKEDAKRLSQFKNGSFKALQEAFSFMGQSDQRKFVAWAAAEVGAELNVAGASPAKTRSADPDEAEDDPLALPSHLDRRRRSRK